MKRIAIILWAKRLAVPGMAAAFGVLIGTGANAKEITVYSMACIWWFMLCKIYEVSTIQSIKKEWKENE